MHIAAESAVACQCLPISAAKLSNSRLSNLATKMVEARSSVQLVKWIIVGSL